MNLLAIVGSPRKGKATDTLVDKALITPSGSLYNVHDVIRDFFYHRLSHHVKKSYHEKVAEYFEDESDDLFVIEAQYHHIKAGCTVMAVELAQRYGEHLINRGFLDEFMGILGMLPDSDLVEDALLLVDVARMLGKTDRNAPGKGHVALAASQALAGHVNGHE